MGHRKKSAPRRGSLAYLPRGRAARHLGRIRYWPVVEEGPVPLAFAGYKAGMTHVFYVEEKKGSIYYGREIFQPVTIIDAPPMKVCGVRVYENTPYGLKTLTEAWFEDLPKDLDRIITLPKKLDMDAQLKKIDENLDRIDDVRVIAATQPRLASVPKKKPDLMEIKIGGGAIEEQVEYAKNLLGKTLSISNVFKEGSYVDVIAVTKGKGFQGPVKRFGVKILSHKARKTKRGVAAIGPWHPARVVYTVPRAGQMGYFQRIEYNKRILKIGSDGKEVTPEGGFVNYGIVRGEYVMLEGSVPGPPKRLIKLRYPARPPVKVVEAPPKITYISLESKQG